MQFPGWARSQKRNCQQKWTITHSWKIAGLEAEPQSTTAVAETSSRYRQVCKDDSNSTESKL